MCRLLRQSTAYTVDLGPAVDRTNAYDEETGLSPTVYLSKASAAQAARNSGTAIAHDARGYYRVPLNTTDTNTLGMLRALFHDSATHLPVWEVFMVIPANVYDSLVDGSDFLDTSMVQWLGTAPLALTSQRVEALVGAMSNNVVTAAAIADGAIDRATFAADTGLQTARSNTAQAGAAGTITLDASASSVTDFFVGAWILITGGTGVGQARVCTAYNGTSKVATIAPNWATNPDNTSTFAVIPAAHLTGIQGNVTGSVASVSGAVGSVTGAVGSVTGAVGSVTGAVGSVTGNVGGNVVGSVASVSGAVGSVTGNVGGNVTGSVGSIATGGIAAASFAAGAIDNAAIAADAIGSSELAATAASEIATAVRTELATELARIDAATSTRATPTQVATELATYDGPTNAEMVARTLAAASYATAANQATMDGKLDTIDNLLDTEIQAIIDALALINLDTDDIQSRLPAALVGGRMDSNMSAINNSNAAAIRQALAAGTIITGTVDSAGFSPTSTQFEADDITEATADHYNGRVIIFTSGAMLGQATSISDYALATGRGHFTVPTMTEAPADNVTFIIV